MAKATFKTYVYAWVSDEGHLGSTELSNYPRRSNNWIPVITDEEGNPKLVEVEVEIPDNFDADWRNRAVKVVETAMEDKRRQVAFELETLRQQRDKLLALEYTPSAEPVDHAADDVLDDDIPF